jgi:hypothetical protein
MSFITGKAKSDNVNPSANSFNSIAVAVGSDATNLIRYSTDGGITWTATGNKTASNELLNMSNLQSIATNGSIWVVVGNKGTSSNQAAYSYDGITWTAFNIDSTNNPTQLSSIAWNGNIFVTGSQSPTNFYYSYNGITWSTSPTALFTSRAIAFCWININTNVYVNNGFWLCGGNGSQSLAFSNDGICWNGYGSTSAFGVNGFCNAIATNGSGLVVIGGSGNSQSLAYARLTPINGFIDPNLIGQNGTLNSISYDYRWTGLGASSPFGTTGQVNSIVYNGNLWLAGGTFFGVNLAYSIDGISWINLGAISPFGTGASSVCNGICWTGRVWVVNGSSNGTTGVLAYSTNPLVSWTSISNPFTGLGYSIASDSNIIPITNDGIYGNGGQVGIQLQKGAQNTMNIISGGNQVATIGEKGFKKISIDEQYGTFIKSPIILVGNIVNTLPYSYNGISYTTVSINLFSSNLDGGIYTFAWNGKIWVAGGNGQSALNTLAWSLNGLTWTGLGKSIFPFICRTILWTGTMFLAAGDDIGSVRLAYSYDGINWNVLGISIFSSVCYSIEYNGTIFVAGGSGTNTLAYSYDGLNWTGLGISIFSDGCLKILWNGTIFIAGGQGTNTLAWSKDGINWTGLGTSIISYACTDIAWSGTYFVASSLGIIGTTILAWSKNGIIWTAVPSSSSILDTNCFSISWIGNRFVALGGSGSNSKLAYTLGEKPELFADWSNNTGSTSYNIHGGIGRLYSGYWNWSGNISNPSINIRTTGNNTAGIVSNGNGISLYGGTLLSNTHIIPKTLLSINDYRCFLNSKILNLTDTSSTLALSGASSVLTLSNTTASTSSSTGALQCAGGAYFGANSIMNANLTLQGSSSTLALSGASSVLTLSNTTGSISSSTGALQCAGGAYFGGNNIINRNLTINSTGSIILSNTTASTSSSTGALQCAGGAYFGANSIFNANVSLRGTTQFSSNGSNITRLERGRNSNNGSTSYTITFSNSFSSTPTVVASIELSSTAYNWGFCINSVSTTSFTYRFFAHTVANPSQCFNATDAHVLNWIAMN